MSEIEKKQTPRERLEAAEKTFEEALADPSDSDRLTAAKIDLVAARRAFPGK